MSLRTVPILPAMMLFGSLFLLIGCSKKTKPITPTPVVTKQEKPVVAEPEPEVQIDPIPVVCIHDSLSLWEGPSLKSGYMNYEIQRGEPGLYWLGKAENVTEDGQEREFYNVRLSDGREGWVLAYYIVPEARSYALIEKTTIFANNNLAAITDRNLEEMTIIAVLEEYEDGWHKIVDNNKNESLWIKTKNLTDAEVDIAVANQAYKASIATDKKDRKDRLKNILEEDAFTDSIFIPVVASKLQDIIDEENAERKRLEQEKAGEKTEESEETGTGRE